MAATTVRALNRDQQNYRQAIYLYGQDEEDGGLVVVVMFFFELFGARSKYTEERGRGITR